MRYSTFSIFLCALYFSECDSKNCTCVVKDSTLYISYLNWRQLYSVFSNHLNFYIVVFGRLHFVSLIFLTSLSLFRRHLTPWDMHTRPQGVSIFPSATGGTFRDLEFRQETSLYSFILSTCFLYNRGSTPKEDPWLIRSHSFLTFPGQSPHGWTLCVDWETFYDTGVLPLESKVRKDWIGTLTVLTRGFVPLFRINAPLCPLTTFTFTPQEREIHLHRPLSLLQFGGNWEWTDDDLGTVGNE